MRLYAKSVSRFASLIDDPVKRLRFLQTAASPPRRQRRLGQFLLIMLAIALFVLSSGASVSRPAVLTSAPIPIPPVLQPPADIRPASDVWIVEKSLNSEVYSNGLRIDNHFLAATHPRSALVFPVLGGKPVQRTEPAGIVFHSTESRQLPFESDENRALKRIGESLLEYVRRHRAYNFVIDRFGRVYRVVPEEQAASHAGYSVWADQNWLYINLNESFLGIAFEAGGSALSPAQVRAAAMLVEMLRRRYQIPSSNFVTHAQVSVNPSNMRVGAHVDWASGFPFQAVGLANTYSAPLPAVWAFGFDCDAHFTRQAADPLRQGVAEAEASLSRNAGAAGRRLQDFKKTLRGRYRVMLTEVRQRGSESAETE